MNVPGMNPANIPAAAAQDLLQQGQQEFKECLLEIQARSPTSRNPALRRKIETYIRKNLEPRGEVMPGVRRTGFANCLITEGVQALPQLEGWQYADQDIVFDQLVTANIAMLNNPACVNACDQITLAQVMDGRPRPSGAPVFPHDRPMVGLDAQGSPVIAFQATHPHMNHLIERIGKSHDKGEEAANGDHWSWARAAWTAVLMQATEKQLRDQLKGRCEGDLIDALVQMAAKAQSKGGEITAPAGGDEKGFKIKFEGNNFSETDLMKLTGQLLTQPGTDGSPPMSMPEPGRDGSASHVFALMRALGQPMALLGTLVPVGGGRQLRHLSLFSQSEVKGALGLTGEHLDEQRELMEKHTSNQLVIEQNGGTYSVRRPASVDAVEADPERDLARDMAAAGTSAGTARQTDEGSAPVRTGVRTGAPTKAEGIGSETPPDASAQNPKSREELKAEAIAAMEEAIRNAAAAARNA